MNTKDLKNFELKELEGLIEEVGQKKYLAQYIFTFIHQKRVSGIDDITTLSKRFREILKSEGYFISQISIKQRLEASDGTIKYQFQLSDGELVESVLLFDDGRKTLCISCQVGCAMNCGFCATGKLKLRRDLAAAEIIEQVYKAEQDVGGKINNLVYMGMGEPFENYENVMRSVRILNHEKGANIGARHITVSTCGIVPGIERYGEEEINSRLAVSLNAAFEGLRSKLMPINNKYPLKELFRAIRHYQDKKNQRVTFEYVLIDGVNDSKEDAKMLVDLLRGVNCNVNLIEFNPFAQSSYKSSRVEAIHSFADVLEQANIENSIRFKKGREIKAACGQLGAKDKVNH